MPGAIGAAAIKSVKQFEELGLTIGKVAAATGLSAEGRALESEVADDAGVSSEAFTASPSASWRRRSARTPAFDKWGVTIAKNADGTVNMNQTLLNAMDTINGISDPLSGRLLGRRSSASRGRLWPS